MTLGVLALGSFSEAQPDQATLSASLSLSEDSRFHWTNETEIYTESNYLPEYGLLTESRLRLYFLKKKAFQAYLGTALERQDLAGGKPPIYIDSVSPLAGVKFTFLRQLSAFAEYRQWIVNGTTANTSLPDPRYGIAGGDLIQFQNPLFFEYYGEVVGVPRVSSALVTTAWTKLGYRETISHGLYVDPYLEFFVRHTPDINLGVETSEPRLGLRMIFAKNSWSTSALIYEAFREREVEGLFVFGGLF